MITREARRRHTGSKIHRVWQCPASAVLPQNTNEDLDARGEPARGRGHVIHKYLECVRTVGIEAALVDVPADLVTLCRALDIDRLPTGLSTEVAFAWNWKELTARELGRSPDLPYRPDGGVDYDKLGVDWSCEIPTTVDATGMAEWSPKGSMEVLRRGYTGDYKTGHVKVPRPSRNGQILIGAVCIRYLWNLDDVTGEVLYIDEDGECYPQREVLDSWTLDIFERELHGVMSSLPALEATFAQHGGEALAKHEGQHCQYCPAYKNCSAKTAFVRELPMELIKLGAKRDEKGDFELVPVVTGKDKKGEDITELQLQLAPGAINARNAAAVYQACERIEAMCRKMRDEVCGIAYHEPVPLSDGRVIARYTWRRREVDGRVAAVVLEKHYGREKVLKKLDIKLSLAAIEELVRENVDWTVKPRPVVTSQKGTGLLDKLLVEIENDRGLAVNTGEECKPHKPRGGKR